MPMAIRVRSSEIAIVERDVSWMMRLTVNEVARASRTDNIGD